MLSVRTNFIIISPYQLSMIYFGIELPSLGTYFVAFQSKLPKYESARGSLQLS